jgi:hypothetical protein
MTDGFRSVDPQFLGKPRGLAAAVLEELDWEFGRFLCCRHESISDIDTSIYIIPVKRQQTGGASFDSNPVDEVPGMASSRGSPSGAFRFFILPSGFEK